MTPPDWGIPLVLVVGAAVVWFGWWHDRRAERSASAGHVTEDDLARSPGAGADPGAQAALAASAHWPRVHARVADPLFLGSGDPPSTAVGEASILLVEDELTDQHLTLTLLDAARRRGRPLVVVADAFGTDVLAMLRANDRTQRARCLPLLADAAARATISELSGAQPLTAADLRAGWLPDAAWGRLVGAVATSGDTALGVSA